MTGGGEPGLSRDQIAYPATAPRWRSSASSTAPVVCATRSMLLLLRHRRPQRQPGHVRPALSAELRVGTDSGQTAALPQRYVSRQAFAGAGGDGGSLRQNRRPHEASGVRGGGHQRSTPPPSGSTGTPPQGSSKRWHTPSPDRGSRMATSWTRPAATCSASEKRPPSPPNYSPPPRATTPRSTPWCR